MKTAFPSLIVLRVERDRHWIPVPRDAHACIYVTEHPENARPLPTHHAGPWSGFRASLPLSWPSPACLCLICSLCDSAGTPDTAAAAQRSPALDSHLPLLPTVLSQREDLPASVQIFFTVCSEPATGRRTFHSSSHRSPRWRRCHYYNLTHGKRGRGVLHDVPKTKVTVTWGLGF